MNMDACKCTCDMTSVNFCVAAFSVHSLCSLLQVRNCTLNSPKRIPTCFLGRQLQAMHLYMSERAHDLVTLLRAHHLPHAAPALGPLCDACGGAMARTRRWTGSHL